MTATVLRHRLFWPVTLIILLALSNLFFTPSFFSIEVKQGHLYGSIIDILRLSAPLVMVGLGMTVVIATRGIDLSVGSVVAISGAMACLQISHLGNQNSLGGVLTAIALALVLAAAAGLWNGFLVAGLGIQPIIATLILLVAGRGIAQLITDGQIITVRSDPFAEIGGGFRFGLPVAILLAAVVFAVATLILRRSALGLIIEAVGGNAEASRLAGIRSRRIVWLVYAFSGITAGIAGLMIASNVNSADGNNAGLWIELDAILAVVIGGTSLRGGRFYLGGTVVGALFIQTLTTTLLTVGVRQETTLLYKALVVTAVCLLQSPAFRARFGRRGSRRPGPTPTSVPREKVPA
jgi:galactofuranose transport system permease protein